MDAIDTATLELWGLERLLSINEVAAYLRVSVSTIYEWRMKGDAPDGGAEDGLDRALLGLCFSLDLGSDRLGALKHLRVGLAGLDPGRRTPTRSG